MKGDEKDEGGNEGRWKEWGGRNEGRWKGWGGGGNEKHERGGEMKESEKNE